MKKSFTFLLLFFLLVIVSRTLFSQDIEIDKLSKRLPEMLGANNVGKEFYFTIPPCLEDESGGSNNFIKIFVTASTKTLVTVEVDGTGFLKKKNSVPNDVIEFNITPSQGQPFTKSAESSNVPERIFPQKAIHVYADAPLVVYCVVRYHYTSDGFLALPVPSLGKEYIVAGWNVDPMFSATWRYKVPNMTGIVAAYDDTRVRFALGGNDKTITAGGMKSGDSTEFILQRGDVWMVSTNSDSADLSGSKIISNKPVAVVTGNMCANIPNDNRWCDYIVEMDLPTYTWGRDYFVPKIPNRKYPSIIRVFAKEPDTRIFRDGELIGNLKTGGGVAGEAFLTMRMVPMEETPRSVVISGDKPIGVTLYNTGAKEDGEPHSKTDPFQMTITPIEQFQKEITFCTPGIRGGQGFIENYLNLVYETDENGKMPDDYMFAEVENGSVIWEKLNSKFPGKDELFSKSIKGKQYAVKLINLPGDAVYAIKANHLFSAYSFGFSEYDSYGYPTSAVLADLEKTDTLCPVPTYTMEKNGYVKNGVVTDMPDDDKIRANLAMMYMDDFKSYNYKFDYRPFVAGETRTTTWTLDVIDTILNAKATLIFTDRRGNDTTIVVKYSSPYPQKKDTLCPVPTYTMEKNGYVKNGVVTDMPDDDKIRSNLGTILINPDSYNYKFYFKPFIPGETRTTTWTLDVIDSNKNAKATLIFTDRRGNDTTIVVEYTAQVNSVSIFDVRIVTISPNPATDYIDVILNGTQWSEDRRRQRRSQSNSLLVYDVLGVCVGTHPLAPSREGESVRIDVSGLAAGVYFVRIGGQMLKFVKL
jgi:hypothetical protein